MFLERYVSRNDQDDEKLKHVWKGLKSQVGINMEHGGKAEVV